MAIVGMPVNVVVTATTHEQTGELFDAATGPPVPSPA